MRPAGLHLQASGRYLRWRHLGVWNGDRRAMTILLSDPRVAEVPVHDCGEPLVALDASFGPARATVRAGVAARLALAQDLLPRGLRLRVVEGHRSITDQRAIIARYSAEVCLLRPGISPHQLHHLVSRFVAPVEVAPHVAGAAVDLTLVDVTGDELDLGTPIDATPEQSDGACYFAAGNISPDARAHRRLLAAVLMPLGLVNYPTEWWHWSYGDRYWALLGREPHAVYGPVEGSGAGAGQVDAA
jgi:zinc D-Ala-D-Ala dipeptidase